MDGVSFVLGWEEGPGAAPAPSERLGAGPGLPGWDGAKRLSVQGNPDRGGTQPLVSLLQAGGS